MKSIDNKNIAPQDNIFFTETALGLLATARSMLLQVNKNKGVNTKELKDHVEILNQATARIYQGKMPKAFIEYLVDFINYQNYRSLFKIKKLLVAIN